MARCICYEFVHDHAQPPAAVRLQLQSTGHEYETYFLVIQLKPADSEAQLPKVGRCIDQSISFRRLERSMNIRTTMKKVGNACQRQLDFLIARARRSHRNRIDGGSKLVVDPVVQFVQQEPLLRERRLEIPFHHDALPMPQFQ